MFIIKPKHLISIIVGFLLIIIVSMSVVTVDQSERGLVLRGGKVTNVLMPGFAFKLPFLDSVRRISIQQQTTRFEDVQAYSTDQQSASIFVSLTYQVPENRIIELYEKFGSVDNLLDRVIRRNITAQMEKVFGQYTAVRAVQERNKLMLDYTASVKAELEKFPVDIISVQIENVTFSKVYEKTIEARMQAEVEIATRRQNLETEKLAADIVRTKAQAEADSKLLNKKSEADGIRLVGEAEAASIKARSDALKENAKIVELITAEKWNGVLPASMIPNSTVPFINVGK